MRFQINVQLDWDIDNEERRNVFARFRKVIARFRTAFPESYDPGLKVGGWAEIETDDENMIQCVKAWMDKQHEKYEIVVTDCWTPDEVARARWLPLVYLADYVDVDARLEQFNRYKRVLCETCGRVDESIVPAPYKIKDVSSRRTVDVFPAMNGLLIVRERVKELLLELVGNEIDWGETCFVDLSGKKVRSRKSDERLLWVRPKHAIGRELGCKPDSPCPKCGTPRTCPPLRDLNEKISTHRVTVEHFGKKHWNIARVGEWHVTDLHAIVLSGGLWAHLYNCGVKGIILPEPQGGLYSAKGEPAIEAERRFANLKTGKEDRFLRMKMWYQKKRPWG
jgi:hypothetical protein